jgi:cholinesterase
MNVPAQIPTQWVQRTQDHIVMSFNYRVNIFGYPNAPGLKDQNVGLLDQRRAVEWARENIAAFGGDPERIIIWGQSAGSISVDYYSFVYPEDPIASGMSLDSGTSFSALVTSDAAQTNFTFVAENVGCSGFDNDPSGLLKCMRGADATKINDFIAHYSETAQEPGIGFQPVVDEKTVFSNYTERMLQGKQARIVSIYHTPHSNTQC